jgi:AAA15 family ATPase/GTPase
MRLVSEISRINNFRSIREAGPIELGDITLLVGPNNSGKSSVLQSVLLLQQGFSIGSRQVRLGELNSQVVLRLRDLNGSFRGEPNGAHLTDRSLLL